MTAAGVNAGTYTLSEGDGPDGYTPSSWISVTAPTRRPPPVWTLAPGENATCTITNTAIAPRLTLVKTVDNGTRTAQPSAGRLDTVRHPGPSRSAVSPARQPSRMPQFLSARTPWPRPGARPAICRRSGSGESDGRGRFDPADHGSGRDVHDHEYGGCADVDVGEGGDEQRWWFGGADGLVVVGCGWGDDPGSCG